MSLEVIVTAIASVVTILGGAWAIISYKVREMEKRQDSQDEKIFLLATGKTLREAMLEAKQKKTPL